MWDIPQNESHLISSPLPTQKESSLILDFREIRVDVTQISLLGNCSIILLFVPVRYVYMWLLRKSDRVMRRRDMGLTRVDWVGIILGAHEKLGFGIFLHITLSRTASNSSLLHNPNLAFRETPT